MGVVLSIVVPMYGVENYLQKCVDSLLQQDLADDEYEIVLVDDGSPDGCGAMADGYARKHKNVSVLHQKNRGLGGARNAGLKMARGKYVQFVDSDDYLEPNVLKKLVAQMDNEQLDVLRFGYQHVKENGVVFEPYKCMKAFVDYRDEVCDGETFLNERLGYGCYAWQFVMRTAMLKGIMFGESLYFEDTEWAPRMLLQTKRASSTDCIVYDYLMREGGITQSVDYEKKWKCVVDKLKVIDSLRETRLQSKNDSWFRGMESVMVMSIVDYVCMNFPQNEQLIMRQLRDRHVFPLSYYHLTRKQRCKALLLSFLPMVYCILMEKKK